MSLFSATPQPDPTFHKCLWTITKKANLYVLTNKGSPSEKSGWDYQKLGKVVSWNFSRGFVNEEGSKKTVFRLTVVKEEGPDAQTEQALNDSFGGADPEKEVYVVQEHFFTDFIANKPRIAQGLSKGPVCAPLLVKACHPSNMNKQGNWLKTNLQKMAGLESDDDTAGVASFTQEPPSPSPLRNANNQSSSSSGSGTAGAAVFGGTSANTGGTSKGSDDDLSDSSAQVLNSFFDADALLASQGTCILYVLSHQMFLIVIFEHTQLPTRLARAQDVRSPRFLPGPETKDPNRCP